ncbi:MAG: hypothetical protein E7653_06655 [Ruminococcaceae bacterium]|nr:hypothetical protein [Oscillospiraceae bacterium]
MGVYLDVCTAQYEEKVRKDLDSYCDRVKEFGEDDPLCIVKESEIISNAYCYLLSINERMYEPYGEEIILTVKYCLSTYAPEKGNFFHYFNRIISFVIKKARAIEKGDAIHNGMTGFSSSLFKRWRIINEYCDANKKQELTDGDFLTISEEFGSGTDKDVLKFKQAYLDFKASYVISSSNHDNDDNDRDDYILDSDQAQKYRHNVYKENRTWGMPKLNDDGEFEYDDSNDDNEIDAIQTVSINSDSYSNGSPLLAKAQAIYDALQARTKPIISDLFTCTICKILAESDIYYEEYSVINKEIMNTYIEEQQIPKDKDIAEKYGKKVESISRIRQSFEAKLWE